ncbi:hypothetical protein ACC668_02910 [Rhizobium ruizarguesonis]
MIEPSQTALDPNGLECGEISAIYRFAYEGRLPATVIGQRDYRSRLPVTMNVVFPARPWSKTVTCSQVARRWLDYARGLQTGVSAGALADQARLIVCERNEWPTAFGIDGIGFWLSVRTSALSASA